MGGSTQHLEISLSSHLLWDDSEPRQVQVDGSGWILSWKGLGVGDQARGWHKFSALHNCFTSNKLTLRSFTLDTCISNIPGVKDAWKAEYDVVIQFAFNPRPTESGGSKQRFDFGVRLGGWTLELDFEIWLWDLALESDFDIWLWFLALRSDFGVGLWSLALRSGFEIFEVWLWHLTLTSLRSDFGLRLQSQIPNSDSKARLQSQIPKPDLKARSQSLTSKSDSKVRCQSPTPKSDFKARSQS